MPTIPVSTSVQIIVGPLIDDTDFKSRETGVAYNAAGMDVDLLKSSDSGTPTTTGITLTTGSTNDWVELSNGYYYVEVTASQNNTLGKLQLVGFATGILPFASAIYDVVPADVYNSLVANTDELHVDVVQWRGTQPNTLSSGRVDTILNAIGSATVVSQRLAQSYATDGGYNTPYMGPHGPGVYLDDASGNTGNTLGSDGTSSDPVDNLSDARLLCTALGIKTIYLVNDTVITLSGNSDDFIFYGIGNKDGNQVTLGNQSCDNAAFWNCRVTGVQGGTGRISINNCTITALSGADIMATNCALTGNITVARDSELNQCWSAVAGSGTPVIDINSVASIDLSIRHYSGGIQFNNAVSTTTVSLEGMGQCIVGATCTSINLTIRGMFSLTDSGTTSSITDNARVTHGGQIRKNQAFSDFEFLMVDSTDGYTPKTGLSGFTVERSIDGAAFASAGGSVTEVSDGIYQYDAVAADTNGDVITWRFAATGAIDATFTFRTVN